MICEHSLDEIIAAFRRSGDTGQPERHIPWHLKALKAELTYAGHQLAEAGYDLSMGDVARVIYPLLALYGERAELKMAQEMAAIGGRWPLTDSDEVLRAIRDTKNLFR